MRRVVGVLYQSLASMDFPRGNVQVQQGIDEEGKTHQACQDPKGGAVQNRRVGPSPLHGCVDQGVAAWRVVAFKLDVLLLGFYVTNVQTYMKLWSHT